MDENENCERCSHEKGIEAPFTAFGKCQCACHPKEAVKSKLIVPWSES